jgi:type I restriction enzyme M protein
MTTPLSTFAAARLEFEGIYKTRSDVNRFVPEHGKIGGLVIIRDARGEPNEQYYKWQFIYALIHSGLYAKDYVGSEVYFPKGNKSAAPLKLDAAIFDSPDWLIHYHSYWKERKTSDLEWLNQHLLAVVEFKKNDKEIERVFAGQVKPAMRERDPSDAFVLGIYYDKEWLYIFQRRDGRYLRYDEGKNQKGDASQIGDLSLHLPDPYAFIPSFDDLYNLVNRPNEIVRTKRSIYDLDTITTIASVQIQNALSDVLRALDKAGLVNQRGYAILVQTIALKIFE